MTAIEVAHLGGVPDLLILRCRRRRPRRTPNANPAEPAPLGLTSPGRRGLRALASEASLGARGEVYDPSGRVTAPPGEVCARPRRFVVVAVREWRWPIPPRHGEGGPAEGRWVGEQSPPRTKLIPAISPHEKLASSRLNRGGATRGVLLWRAGMRRLRLSPDVSERRRGENPRRWGSQPQASGRPVAGPSAL